MATGQAVSDVFPSLSTRQLGAASILHPASCCPSMDVCLVSDPSPVAATSATGSRIRLYRLSGGSSSSTADEGSKSAVSAAFAKARAAADGPNAGSKVSGSAEVWQTNVSSSSTKTAVITANAATMQKRDVKGKGKAPQVQEAVATDVPAHMPESIVWSPDGDVLCTLLQFHRLTIISNSWRIPGQLIACGSSAANVKLYSVHDGQPILHSVRLAPIESTSSGSNIAHETEQAAARAIYFLTWQDVQTPFKRESILAEDMSNALPRLPKLLKTEETKPYASFAGSSAA